MLGLTRGTVFDSEEDQPILLEPCLVYEPGKGETECRSCRIANRPATAYTTQWVVPKQRDLPLGRSSGRENKELGQIVYKKTRHDWYFRNDSTRCLLEFLTEPRGGTTLKTADLSCGTVCRKTDVAQFVRHATVHYGPRLCNRVFWDKGT